MSVAGVRLRQTTAAGLPAKPCGCPEQGQTGADCCKLRKSLGVECLCGCHLDRESVIARRRAVAIMEGAFG